MNFRKINLRLIAVFLPLAVLAFLPLSSEKLSGAEQPADPDKPMYDKIIATAKAVNTLECNFSETKTIAVLANPIYRSGKLYYRKPNNMRWEYSKKEYGVCGPKGNYMVRDGKRDNGGSRAFAMISRITTSFMNGSPIDRKNFSLNYHPDREGFVVVLMPKNPKIKATLDYIMMHFDTQSGYIKSFEMHHQNDATKITFSNRQTNQQLDDDIFE
ncbi:MAG: outer membrane lipoprotein carrier protein LolA [Bacteroidales bacterium]|jgi:Outer membrane lipoprotein-sorting protein|nr:outer membrane lipoprotein carrier protein LolA [Bacteroidales bacterium]MDD4421271.1 outer membrane lipoprotein carrier protein LolA [Bacteroidales bacterium]